MNKFILFLRHAVALIREDKLFSAIYIAGTAVAIASAMVIAIVFNMMLADIPPESNRNRTLYVYSQFIPTEKTDDVPYHQGHSSVALDSCYRRMKCVEAATGIIPAYQNRFSIDGFSTTDRLAAEQNTVSAIATDPDFFRLYELTFLSGRPFSEKEYRDGERVCVVTDKVAAASGDSPSETIRINDKPFRVVGVVKAVSAFLEEATADVYMPYTVEGMGLHPNNRNPLRNGDHYVDVPYQGNLNTRILLREGYTLKDFNAELEPLRQQYGAVISSQMGEQAEWVVDTRTHFFHKINFFSDNDQGLADQAKNLMPPALLMLLFLFLPAINLSGLVSNRMEARRAEMGIRKAFGGKRRTLLNEVVNENLVLTLLGGAVGWVLSWAFISAVSESQIFVDIFQATSLPNRQMSLDFRMFFTPTLFLIAFVCCAVLNLMAALLPAWHSLRKPIVESLNQKR